MQYTKATKINIIAHSMGVTLGRGIVKGGRFISAGVDLGPSLTDKVDTFVAIAGANYGLVNCQYTFTLPTCGEDIGFYPGSWDSTDMSEYLRELNSKTAKEGSHVFSIFSTYDDLIGSGDIVFGRYTS